MAPDYNKFPCPRAIHIGLLSGTVKYVKDLSDALDNLFLSSLPEKAALEPVDVVCRPVCRLVTGEHVFPQDRSQPGIQRRLLILGQFRDGN